MNLPLDSQPEPVLLIIADISGYTRYMTAHVKTLAHSQIIISELVNTIVAEVKLPLEVAKLEGDAVFLVCRKSQISIPWAAAKRQIGDNLLGFFRGFGRRVGELTRSVSCGCQACTHIEGLKLKIVIHSGEALFHRVLNFVELAGVDVIIVHRLLKNSVGANQYLLLTEAGSADVEFSETIPLTNHREIYDDIGLIKARVHVPPGERLGITKTVTETLTFGQRYHEAWQMFIKLYFAPILHPVGQSSFQHVSSDASLFGRVAFSALMLLLTPLFVPVGAIYVLFHALRQRKGPAHRADDHVHKPDGSCCDRPH